MGFDLRGFRKSIGLSQKQLSKILGVGQSFISQMENGKDHVPEHLIEKLKNLYNEEVYSYSNKSNIINDINKSVKDRLIDFLNYKGINKSDFGRKIGVSTSYVNSMRRSIQPDKIDSIAQIYPDLNIAWLLTGQGDMLLTNPSESVDNSKDSFTSAPKTISELLEAIKKRDESIERRDKENQRLRAALEKRDETIEKLYARIDKLQEQIIERTEPLENTIRPK